MKTNTFKIDWLIPVLGIALFGGGYSLTKSYLGFEADIRSGEQYIATLGRLFEDCNLNAIRMQAQSGGCFATARHLDELVSANLATEHSQLALADPRTRTMVEIVSSRIARLRSESPPMGADLPADRSDREVAEREILTKTPAGTSPGT